jgi:pullulanase
MVVNYMSAHDNNTLWDKLLLANGSNTKEERLAMNRLGATLLFISKGIVFFQAGEEMLRTKGGDENSYKSSDAVNNIDWSVLEPGRDEYEMMLYYKELIRTRKSYAIFREVNSEITATQLDRGRAVISINDRVGGSAIVIANPTDEAMRYNLNGSWHMVINGVSVMENAPVLCQGEITISAYSAVVLLNDVALGK